MIDWMEEAIIFDFDGVVVHSEPVAIEILREILRRRFIELPAGILKEKLGVPFNTFASRVLLGKLSQGEVNDVLKEFYDEVVGNLERYVLPVEEVVNYIKGGKGDKIFAVASMNSRLLIEKISKILGILQQWDLIVSIEQVTHPKPNPEVYLKTLELLGIEADRCIVIEDSPIGVRAANRAGVACYVFLSVYNKPEDFKGLEVKGYLGSTADLFSL